MKPTVKILSWLLILCLFASILSGCARFGLYPLGSDTITGTPETSDAPKPEDFLPRQYTLTEQDLSDFFALVETVKPDVLSASTCEEAEAIVEQLTDVLEEMQRQARIAEVLYYCHQDSKEANANYLFAKEAVSEAHLALVALEQAIYEANPPYRDEYFDSMTPEEFEAAVALAQAESIHSKLEAETITQYYQTGRFSKLFNPYLESASNLAKTAGYENYYEYASAVYYNRDYGTDERETFRRFVNDHIIPFCESSYEAFSQTYNTLNKEEKTKLSLLIDNAPYDDITNLGTNHVLQYIATLPESVKNGMMHMFDHGNAIFAQPSWSDSYEGAFTTVIDDPFCYFGPGYYQNTFTLIHELGHYYAELHMGDEAYSYDIAETHSQGNELLFLHYLNGVLDEDLYKTAVYYKLYTFAYTVIIATVLDCVEEQIYSETHDKSRYEYTDAQFHSIFNEGCKQFDLTDDLRSAASELYQEVCLTSPVYYISYATSGIAALTLYSMCLTDFEGAKEAYCKIVEEVDWEKTFTGTLEKAGIPTPFQETAYEIISSISFQ